MKTLKIFLFCSVLWGSYFQLQAQVLVSTFAGSGYHSSTDGSAMNAGIAFPRGIAVDASGNVFVVSGLDIRKISTAGVVSTIAGCNGVGVAVDASGNVFVADYNGNKIKKINSSGVISTYAGTGEAGFLDGSASSAKFNRPTGVVVDAIGNVFVTDEGNFKIRKISPAGVVSTFAGSGLRGAINGAASSTRFYELIGITVDLFGNVFALEYDASTPFHTYFVRKITPEGIVSTYLNGYLPNVTEYYSYGITTDAYGNVYFFNNDNIIKT